MQSNMVQAGTLYVVALPIGNYEDISPRALNILSQVRYIACEDTRHFLDFAKNFESLNKNLNNVNLISYHDHTERDKSDTLIDIIKSGNDICLVSDAGTPQVADPGYHLIKKCYENKINVVGLPGPSSVTLALSICPIGGESFYFAGFTPEKTNDRKIFLKELLKKSDRNITFEAPHRILEHLEDASEITNKKIFLARELTKKFEEALYATPKELSTHLKTHKALGEFILIYPKDIPETTLEEIKAEVKRLIDQNLKPNDILKSIQSISNMNRRQIYDLITEMKHLLKKINKLAAYY